MKKVKTEKEKALTMLENQIKKLDKLKKNYDKKRAEGKIDKIDFMEDKQQGATV